MLINTPIIFAGTRSDMHMCNCAVYLLRCRKICGEFHLSPLNSGCPKLDVNRADTREMFPTDLPASCRACAHFVVSVRYASNIYNHHYKNRTSCRRTHTDGRMNGPERSIINNNCSAAGGAHVRAAHPIKSRLILSDVRTLAGGLFAPNKQHHHLLLRISKTGRMRTHIVWVRFLLILLPNLAFSLVSRLRDRGQWPITARLITMTKDGFGFG